MDGRRVAGLSCRYYYYYIIPFLRTGNTSASYSSRIEKKDRSLFSPLDVAEEMEQERLH